MTIIILWGFGLYRNTIFKNLTKYFYWHFPVKYSAKIQAIFSCHGTLPCSNRDKIAIEFNYGIFSFEVTYFKLGCHFLCKNRVLQFPNSQTAGILYGKDQQGNFSPLHFLGTEGKNS